MKTAIYLLPILCAFTVVGLCPEVHADTTLSISPLTAAVAPGTDNVIFSGDIGNNDQVDNPLAGFNFNLVNTPAGADPTTAVVFDSLFLPDPLPSSGYIGQLFSLDIDPSAPTGVYTGNFDVSYGDDPDVNQNFTLDVENSTTTTPESNSATAMILGLITCAIYSVKNRMTRPYTLPINKPESL